MFGDEAHMYKLEDVQLSDLGRVAEVTITKDDCLLMKVNNSFLLIVQLTVTLSYSVIH